jgi:hypothetical protein
MKTYLLSLLLGILCSLIQAQPTYKSIKTEIVELLVKPSLTDSTIVNTDVEHLVLYTKD